MQGNSTVTEIQFNGIVMNVISNCILLLLIAHCMKICVIKGFRYELWRLYCLSIRFYWYRILKKKLNQIFKLKPTPIANIYSNEPHEIEPKLTKKK